MPFLASVAFNSVVFEEWVPIVVIGSFAVVACIFLIGTIRALLLPKDKREHLANLPLDGDWPPPQPPTPDPTSPHNNP